MIGNGITQIDQDMFHGCNGFTGDLTIGSSVTEIGDDAFSSCNGFTGSLTIPNSVTKIGDSAFSGCNCFTGSLIIPDSVTEIGDSAFYGCSGFNGSLIIPDSVTEIGFSLFSGCSGFTGNLVIPDSVTEIGSSSFFGCSGFTGNLVIPDGVTEIGSFAFFGCSGFTGNLVISDSVTTIESSAFYGCSGLTGNLVIPDSVTTIGYSAFSGCSGFNGSLSIPKEVTSIDYDAFEDTNFQNIYYSGTEAQWNALGVQGLPESCVIHCAGGTSGEIPDSPGGDTSEIKPDIGEDGVGLVTAQTADSIAIDGVTYSYGSSLNVHDEDYLGKYVSYYLNLAGTEIINIVDLTRVQGIYTGPGAYGNEIIIGGKTYSYEGDPSSLDSYLNQEVAVYYYYYERSYACYVAPCSVEVGTLTNLDILSTPATAYLNGTAYPIYSSRADWLVKKLRPLLNGGQVVLELEDGKVVGVRTLASYYETPFFQVSLDKEAVDWRNGSFETNQIGVDISLRSIADLPQKIRAALRADPTRTITVEEITFSSSEGGPYITFGQGETSSTTTYADGKGNLRPGDSFSLSAFAYLGDKWAWGNTLSVPVKFTATVRYRINGVSETATVSSAVRLSNQDEIERLAQLEQQQKEEVAPKLEEEVRDASGEAKSLMPRDTAVINLGYTLQTNLGVDDKQVKLLAQDVLTRILFYTTPKKAWQEELRDKIESKVFTKVFGNYKPPVSTDSSTLRLNYVMATGEYGNQYIQLVCQLNNFSLNGSEFARYATIKYEVLGPAGNEKKEVPQRLRSGALGQMTATNIDAFAKAAYSVVESELKRAYNLAYGNDFNLAADDLLNDCVKQILKGKKKTASDVVWEFITAPAKNYKVKCPVDVYVYDESDSLCASIVDDQVELPSDEFEMEIVGDAKYLRGVPYNYRLEYVATAPGSMNVEITERINKDSSLRTVALENVPLYAGAQYDQLSPSNLIGQASEYRIESGTCLVQTVDRMYDALTLGLPSIQLLGLTAQRNSTGCTAVLQVRNSGAGDGTAQYYVVAYDANWRMVALVTDEFELTAGAAKNRSYTLNADAPVAHVKAFALEGNDFSPLCASVVCDI